MTKIKPADVFIILLTVLIIIFLFMRTYSQPQDSSELLVRVDEESWRFTLEDDRIIHIPGPLGDTEIHIQAGEIHVGESPCNSKICIAAGTISKPGQWIVCLPNHVFISIEGEDDGSLDSGGEEVDDVVF